MFVYDNDNLYKSLKELAIIDENDLGRVFDKSKEKNISFGKQLVDEGLISDENLGKLIADLFQTPFIKLSEVSIEGDILRIIPEVVAKKQKVISFKKDEKGLHLAINNPKNLELIEFIEKKAGLPINVYFATENDINNALILYTKDVEKAFDEIIAENVSQVKNNKGTIVEPPIVKIVDTIFSYAYKNKASDIHLEPEREVSLVRFRIDGVLHDIVKFPINIHQQIVARIKVMTKLRTDEHQTAQDGKLQVETDDDMLDIRVSVLPIISGEKIVMRLLSKNANRNSLSDLGFSEENIARIEEAYKKPFGMILSTGPTGSGKTTTLYTILKKLNRRDVNIMTIEDPVEYEIESINQIQVNVQTGLSFSEGLRSIVRQDPDIILVGEIRDVDTANIAVNSAMTGHLVLSTLHTNDASTAIPRLFDMKVEPFLIASSINVIVGQRLVRAICVKCRVSSEVKITEYKNLLTSDLIKKYFEKSETVRLYKGKGCSVCHNTGYKDRLAIAEVLVMNETIREAIDRRKDSGVIRQLAIKNGMTTMLDDGIDKVKKGLTTIDEVIRVTKT